MGTFNVQISIGDQQRAQWIDLDALVDTGASITSVPASVLRQLGVTPLMQQRFQFGQGEVTASALSKIHSNWSFSNDQSQHCRGPNAFFALSR